jgi:hypothetical protein
VKRIFLTMGLAMVVACAVFVWNAVFGPHVLLCDGMFECTLLLNSEAQKPIQRFYSQIAGEQFDDEVLKSVFLEGGDFAHAKGLDVMPHEGNRGTVYVPYSERVSRSGTLHNQARRILILIEYRDLSRASTTAAVPESVDGGPRTLIVRIP